MTRAFVSSSRSGCRTASESRPTITRASSTIPSPSGLSAPSAFTSARDASSVPFHAAFLASAARELSELTGTPLARCVEAIERTLLAGYECEPIPETGRPPFAFRLHQFISKGDTLYGSLEPAGQRYLTLNGQRFVPDGQRARV